MSEANVLVVRRFFEEPWNRGRLDVAADLMAPEHVHHLSGEDLGGPEEVKALVTYVRTVFPDLEFVLDDEIAAGDKVVVRWTASGTHVGEFDGVPPTGRMLTWTGIDIVRLSDDRIVELWGNDDALGMEEQLRA